MIPRYLCSTGSAFLLTCGVQFFLLSAQAADPSTGSPNSSTGNAAGQKHSTPNPATGNAAAQKNPAPNPTTDNANAQKKLPGQMSIKPPPKMNHRPIELEGEVVDTWCWSSGVMGDGKGPKHHSCGLACVMGGVTAGIVDDNDNLYIAAKSKAFKGCKEQLTPFVARRVRIKGSLTERGGCRLLKISEVKDLGPAEKFYKTKAK